MAAGPLSAGTRPAGVPRGHGNVPSMVLAQPDYTAHLAWHAQPGPAPHWNLKLASPPLPPVRPYHPTTFLERGVLVPFTTPILIGTRTRPQPRQGLELIIPSLAGGRGVYIMDWGGLTSVCSPTLHDRELSARIAPLGSVTPSAIRRAARSVAADGLAGEEAMEAALAATDSDKEARLLANYLLLMALISQVNILMPPSAADAAVPASDVQACAQNAIDRIAPQVGRDHDWIVSALEDLATAMSTIGVGAGSALARVPSMINVLQQVRNEVEEWSGGQASDDQVAYAEMVCSVADCTLKSVHTTLDAARAATKDMVQLLRSWSADSDKITGIAARPEWLLDGWEQVCVLWNYAQDDADRRAALVEMVQLVPIIPKEVMEWSGLTPQEDPSARVRRHIPINEDWRTGATVFNLIARNESFRALTC